MKRTISSVLSIGALVWASATVTAATISNIGEDKSHVVIKGDTLWDISEAYKGDPFTWPVLWEFNPYIRNPHLIYPGDIVKITERGIIVVPKRAELPVEVLTPEEDRALEVVTLMPEPEVWKMGSPMRARSAFISEGDIGAEGSILSSRDNSGKLLALHDKILISVKDKEGVGPGTKFSAFIDDEVVTDPKTGWKLGKVVENVGTVTVTRRVGDLFEAQVTESFKEIHEGTILRNYDEPSWEVEVSGTDLKVQASVLRGLEPQTEFAEVDIIFIDKGKKDGLKDGNLMLISRDIGKAKDTTTGAMVKLPPKRVGVLLVIEARDNTSTCIITNSVEQIYPGDMAKTFILAEG